MVARLLFQVSRSQNDASRIVRCPKICSELTPTDMIVWGEIIVLKSKPQIYKPKALPHRPKTKWSQDKNIFVLSQSHGTTKRETRSTKKETKTHRPRTGTE